MLTISNDVERVSGFLGTGHTEYLRLFVPIEGDNELTFESWSDLADAADVELNEHVRWRDIARGIPSDRGSRLHPASGSVELKTAQAICELWPKFTDSVEVNTALWPGYAGDSDVSQSVDSPCEPDVAERYGGLVLQRHVSAWLSTRNLNRRIHFPIYSWPDDKSVLISCPIYSNSVYVSGPAGIGEHLLSCGLDVVSVNAFDVSIQVCKND